MKNKTLAFLDIETTGTDFIKHEIIELGCLLVKEQDDGTYKVIDEIEMKIQPTRIETADPSALRVNGYDPAAWFFAHSLKDAMTALATKCQGAVVVAHNVSFDWSFLGKAFLDCDIPDPFFYAKMDTISMAYTKLKDFEDVNRLTLYALCEYFGVQNNRAHTALADARATFEVFEKMMAIK